MKRPWLFLIYIVLAPVVVSVLSAFIINKGEAISDAASVEYVDKKNSIQDENCLILKGDIQRQINLKADKTEVQHLKENDAALSKTLEIMDKRIYDLWMARSK